MSDTARLDLPALTIDSAEGAAKALLVKAKAESGFVPNMYAKMANAPGLLETYLLGYQRFREESGFTPAEQEVVLLTISRFHACTYCMAAHSMIADKMSKVPADVLKALRDGSPLPDAKLAMLSEFTHIMVEQRGKPTPEQMKVFLNAGYSERQVLEIILAIAVKTLSNYSNHLFHTEVDAAFRKYTWEG
ncbi:MAG TPA: carboxymuconolactone decarboxylase family protein [Acidisarcina sp.]|nr:carboxymuconolactone decarboxylase family protein [Acidisarcina sp.]